MSIRKKIRKFRQDPGLFVHDLVASRPGVPPWLVSRLETMSTGLFVRWACEQETVGPLVPRLQDRANRFGVESTSRVLARAVHDLRGNGDRAAGGLLFAAWACTLAEIDLDSAVSFVRGQLKNGVSAGLAEAVVDASWRHQRFELGSALLEYLEPDSPVHADFTRARIGARIAPRLNEALETGEDALRQLIDELIAEDESLPTLWVAFSVIYSDFSRTGRNSRLIAELSERLLQMYLDAGEPAPAWVAARVADVYLHKGDIGAALRVVESHPEPDQPPIAARLLRLRSLDALRRSGFDYQPASPEEPHHGLPGRVLFSLHHSAPFHSNGYATRGHGLLAAINQRGWDVFAVTRMGYPQDLQRLADIEFRPRDVVDGVEYLRIRGNGLHLAPLRDYLIAYADRLQHLARKREPEIIHAHSNALVGLVSCRVARSLGIPSIYEIRGLWEVTRASRQPGFADSEYYELLHQMEVRAAREADAVVCITEGLADEMVRCGIDREKITVIPNGVDVARFAPRERDAGLEAELGLGGKQVIGYVGSLVDYEGLDDLMQGVKILVDRGYDGIAVLIVGDGVVREALERQVAELGLGSIVTFTGRVPHEQVERYYSLIDIAPFPRKSLPVTEMVSPLKPFEAMAMDKIVVASDVAALAEVIDDGGNGFLFAKDDPEALARALERALAALAGGAGSDLAPRAWVSEHRSWAEMARRLENLYQRLSSYRVRPALIELSEIELSEPVVEVRDAYRAREDCQPLRDDDYARLSHVLSVLDGGASILDVGIGPGQFLNIVTRAGRFEHARGVDLERHPSFLTLGEPFEVDYLSVEKLPYSDGEFEVVTCLEVIEHLDDAIFDQSLAELRRVCSRQLVITVPFRERVLATDHQRRFDIDDFERLFPDADITIMRKAGTQRGLPTYWALIEERR